MRISKIEKTNIIIVSVLISFILISGCINPVKEDKKETIYLGGPSIDLDQNNNLSIIWIEYNDDEYTNEIEYGDKDYKRMLSIINDLGELINNKEELKLFPKENGGYQFFIDSDGGYNFVDQVRVEKQKDDFLIKYFN